MNGSQATPTSSTLTDRIGSLEKMFEKFMTIVTDIAPVASFIPGAAPIVATIEGVGGVVEKVIDESKGVPDVDNASLAAGAIAHSTGNSTLDLRLANLEIYIEKLGPFLSAIANELGLGASVPASSVVSVATATVNAPTDTIAA